MKIVCIFAERLYSAKYNDNDENELERLINSWTDPSYLNDFAENYGIENIEEFINEIIESAERFRKIIVAAENDGEILNQFFEPLEESESKKKLSLVKGKKPKSRLRLYAIKIDVGIFLIVGGAIKMSQKMDGHPTTKEELKKLKAAREYLKSNDVFDDLSFYEFLID